MSREKSSYTVIARAGSLLCAGLCIAVSVGLLSWSIAKVVCNSCNSAEFGPLIGLSAVMLAASCVITYFVLRPRVVVRGEEIVYYPRFGAKTGFCVHDITRRKAEPVRHYDMYGGFTPDYRPGIRLSPVRVRVLGFRVHPGAMPRLRSVEDITGRQTVTYRAGELEFTLRSDMINAERFDRMVLASLGESSK